MRENLEGAFLTFLPLHCDYKRGSYASSLFFFLSFDLEAVPSGGFSLFSHYFHQFKTSLSLISNYKFYSPPHLLGECIALSRAEAWGFFFVAVKGSCCWFDEKKVCLHLTSAFCLLVYSLIVAVFFWALYILIASHRVTIERAIRRFTILVHSAQSLRNLSLRLSAVYYLFVFYSILYKGSSIKLI